MYVCMYEYLSICIYIYIHTYIHTYVRTYIHTYIHIYIYIERERERCPPVRGRSARGGAPAPSPRGPPGI